MAAPNLKNNKKKKAGILTASDIMKGYTSFGNQTDIWAGQPWQCIPLEDKNEDWIKWNANWFENIALKELPAKAKRLQKLYNLAAGVMDRRDYSLEPEAEFREHLKSLNITENDQTLLDQFFPIIPNIINVLVGEQIKRDKNMVIEAKDPESRSEQLDYKTGLVKDILNRVAMQQKQQELVAQGIIPGGDTANQYQQEMQAASELAEAEMKFKSFRTIAERWAQKFVDLFGVRSRFNEIELFMFVDSLIADEAIISLNMREDNFDAEPLRPMCTYVNISPNKRYYSESNFVVNIEFMSIADIITSFRNDLNDTQVELLEKQQRLVLNNGIIFQDQNGRSESYYDTTQSYDSNQVLSASMKEELSAKSLRDYLVGAIKGGGSTYSDQFSDIKLHRVSKIWFRSQRKIGLLTKKDGINPEPVVQMIDENFIVTEEPEYDNSLLKENSDKNLIKGEHVEWKWAPEWRYIVKIGQNVPIWTPKQDTKYENIYLYGQPVRFQFKREGSIYDAKPPIEGCRFSNTNTRSVSLVEKVKPWQIIYNVLNNKAVKLLPNDLSKKLIVPRTQMRRNSLFQEDGVEPVIEFMEHIQNSSIIDIDDSKAAAMDSTGRFLQPFVAELSLIQDISLYFQTAQFVKQQAFESIGVSAQRLSEIGKSESATGVQQAVEGSVNQTEIYFELFNVHFLPRVWNLIIEAGQYYTTLSDTFAESYLTSEGERAFFDVNKMDLLMRDMFVQPKNTADIRKVMSDLKQLTIQDNTMGATFLDKIQVYLAKSPTEALEKIQQAEEQRQKQESAKFEQEQKLQQQQQQFLEQQKQQDYHFQDAELQKELDSKERIAEGKNNVSIATIPNNDSSFADSINAGKLQQQNDLNDANTQLNTRKQALSEQQQQDNTTLQREKMQLEREKMQSQENIALQNKNAADIKFMQMQKNRNKKS